LYSAIKSAEQILYALPDRHLETLEVQEKTARLQLAKEAFLDRMPKVFDPFAGGGAIPLEAARLGCRSYGNDINPVAHIIQKGVWSFHRNMANLLPIPKPNLYNYMAKRLLTNCPTTKKVYTNGDVTAVKVANRLSFDVEFYAKKLLQETEKEIGHLYPANEQGKKPIAYYWARVGTCSNPSCRAEVPLLKQFYLANTSAKQVYLKPIIEGTKIDFEIKKGKYNEEELKGWNNRGNLVCPCCGSVTDVKSIKIQSISNTWKQRILTIIEEGKIQKNTACLPNWK
jgi:adenine-specific DNA methylase